MLVTENMFGPPSIKHLPTPMHITSYLCVVVLELSSSWDACLSTEGDHLRNGLVKEENGPVERCEPLLEVDCVPLLVASCSAIVGISTTSHGAYNSIYKRLSSITDSIR